MGKQGIQHNQLYFLYNNKLYILLKIENNIIEAIDIDKNKIKNNIIYDNDKIQFISVSEPEQLRQIYIKYCYNQGD